MKALIDFLQKHSQKPSIDRKLLFFALGFSALALFTRFWPHLWNTTAIGAFALFLGAHLKDLRMALVLLFVSLFLSDSILGFHILMPVVYLSLALNLLLARKFGGHAGVLTSVLLAAVGSLQFYFVTNGAVWLFSGLYSNDLSGLMSSYVMGLPFLRNQMAGDIFYTAVSFFAWDLVRGSSKKIHSLNNI